MTAKNDNATKSTLMDQSRQGSSIMSVDKVTDFNLKAQEMIQKLFDCKTKLQAKIAQDIEDANKSLDKKIYQSHLKIDELIKTGNLEENIKQAELKLEVHLENSIDSLKSLKTEWNLEKVLSDFEDERMIEKDELERLFAKANRDIQTQLSDGLQSIASTVKKWDFDGQLAAAKKQIEDESNQVIKTIDDYAIKQSQIQQKAQDKINQLIRQSDSRIEKIDQAEKALNARLIDIEMNEIIES